MATPSQGDADHHWQPGWAEFVREIKGEKLYVALGASKVRRRLKGHGFGVRKVYSDGKNRAVIIHTATGDHLRQLEAFFQDVLSTPTDSYQPHPGEDD
jgi:hypothetical protein